MAPLPHGKNLPLSDCLGQGRRQSWDTRHTEGQMFLTDIFQEQEFSVLKNTGFFQDGAQEWRENMIDVCGHLTSDMGMGENSEINTFYFSNN